MVRSFLLAAVALLATNVSAVAASTGSQNTATTLTAAPNPASVGSKVLLAGTVVSSVASSSNAPATPLPTGSLTFLDGTTPLSSASVPLIPITGFTPEIFAQVFGSPDSTALQFPLTGSLDGSGKPDLVLYAVVPPGASSTANGELQVQTFVNDGNGKYTIIATQHLGFPTSPATPTVASAAALVDVNDDGKPDLLYQSFVAYGNGNGTFQQPMQLPFLATGFDSSYAADVNGDGKLDIVAVNTPPTASGISQSTVQYQVTVFRNEGNGTFSSLGAFAIAPPSTGYFSLLNVFDLSFVDLNGDGKPDILSQTNVVPFGNSAEAVNLNVMLNNGDGTFAVPLPVATPHSSTGDYNLFAAYLVASGDFTGDGKTDIALAYSGNESGDYIALLPGNGDGTFGSPSLLSLFGTKFAPGGSLSGLIAADVNADGKLDLVLGDGMVALGNGDGTFTLTSPLFSQPAGANQLAAYPLVLGNFVQSAAPSFVFVNLQPNAPAVFTLYEGSGGSLALSSLAPGTHTITAQYSGDANYAPSTSKPVTVTVSAAASTAALTSSANPSYAGQSVTYTAAVTSSGPAPTGSLVFSSGSVTLATIPLANGSASYSTIFNTAGNQTITASYSGDANTQPSTATVNQAVVPAVSVGPGPGGSTSITVTSGSSVNTTISLGGSPNFSGIVTLSCTGLPTNASCIFDPATVAVSGAVGTSTGQTISLTVRTYPASTTASILYPLTFGGGTLFACGLLFAPIRRRHTRLFLAVSFSLILAGWGAVGCGGGSSSKPATPAATPAGTYTFNVVASSGAVQTSTAYSLTVQ